MSKIIKKEYLEPAVESFNIRTAMEEATRCLLCHDAPCSIACPAGTDPGKFIRSIRFRNVKGAAETIRENNILGGCCADVCPYDELCEGACSRTGIDKPIQIGRLQRFAVEQEGIFGMKILKAPAATKAKVACIGAGPASLACASKLAMDGYKVTIFEEKAKAGGVLTYGIAPSRLSQETVDTDIQKVVDIGVEFKFNTKVGKDITIEGLRADGYKAFFIGAGLWEPKMVDIPGLNLKGVTNAVDFLSAARSSNGTFDVGKNVIVIGGGDVAMDCAATASLLGAERTTIVYRRTVAEAPAEISEVKYIQSMGINMFTKFSPKEVVGENGKVTGLVGQGTDDFSELKLKASTIVFAVGQAPEDMKNVAEVKLADKGLVAANDAWGTDVEDIFAAGDIVNGGNTVVQAVADGKVAADSIAAFVTKKEGAK